MKHKKSNINRDQFACLFKRGTELLHQGDVVQASTFLERAHELISGDAGDPAHVDLIINLSGAHILNKKFKQAISLLEPLSRQEPDHVMVWMNLGAAYLGNPILARDEDQRCAIAAFERALEVNPAAPNVAYNLGLIHRDRDEIDRAIYWFERAIQASPLDQDARRLLRHLQDTPSSEEE